MAPPIVELEIIFLGTKPPKGVLRCNIFHLICRTAVKRLQYDQRWLLDIIYAPKCVRVSPSQTYLHPHHPPTDGAFPFPPTCPAIKIYDIFTHIQASKHKSGCSGANQYLLFTKWPCIHTHTPTCTHTHTRVVHHRVMQRSGCGGVNQ